MLRATVDVERAGHPKAVTPRCQAAYDEIVELYCAANALSSVRPPRTPA
jgi:hypothetical protein